MPVGPSAPGAPPWLPMPMPVSGPADELDDGRLLSGRAIALVATCIGLGIVMQVIAYTISRDSSRNIDSQIRWDIVLTVLQYAIVAAIVVSQITPKIKLRWGPGSPVARAAIGAAVGLGGGGLILLMLHASSGTVTSDPRVVLLMSGGEATRIIAAFALTCLAAPLVEEVLFRGLLLESLRRHHAAMALIVSSMFFAVWHLNRQALIYYTAMGCIFGALYLKRGLIASMTAHFCFNGALTVAAMYIVLGPSHTYAVDGVKVTVAAGWTDETAQATGLFTSGSAVYLQGPDASVIAVMAFNSGPFAGRTFDADTFAQRLSSTPVELPGGTYDANSVHEVDLPTVGKAVEINFSLSAYTAYKGEYVFFGANNQIYMAMLINGGSPKADSDFTKMLNTLQPAASAGLPVS